MPKKAKVKERLYVPREKYLAAGAHIGTTFKTASMKKFIYKIRPNGLAVLNIGELDRRLTLAANMIAAAKKPIIVCRKDIGWEPGAKFSEVTGSSSIIGRFMPGSFTNPSYKEFREPDLMIVIDPVADKQAIREAATTRIPIISLADTAHDTAYIDLALPVNNKGKKAISLVLWAIAQLLAEKRGQKFELKPEDFGWD